MRIRARKVQQKARKVERSDPTNENFSLMLKVPKAAVKANPLRKPRITHALSFAGSLLALVLGLLAGLAQNAPKTEVDSWTAPARAARKQNPIPADATSL